MDVHDDMQREAKALADPSRFRIFRHIADASDPVGVAELTELLGFNHNAIRQHLAVLVDARLIAEGNEQRSTRGRPRKEYTLRSDALRSFGSVSGSYELLAEMLLELSTSGDEPYDVGFRSAAKPLPSASHDTTDIIATLVRQLAVDGFEPDVADAQTARLNHCPFADVAARNPGVVCELHRGLIDGYLRGHESAVSIKLVTRKPHRAGCLVQLLDDHS